MSNIFIGYKSCSTCSKAEKLLKDLNIEYSRREIIDEVPTVEELKAWKKLGNIDTKLFFNTRGGAYRELNLKENYDNLSEDERLDLLSKDGMLIKRPLLITKDKVLIGFKESEYRDLVWR